MFSGVVYLDYKGRKTDGNFIWSRKLFLDKREKDCECFLMLQLSVSFITYHKSGGNVLYNFDVNCYGLYGMIHDTEISYSLNL